MTFSQRAKAEILKSVRNAGSCCACAFLTAVIKSIGSLTLGHDGYAFSVESDNVELLTLLEKLALQHLGVKSSLATYNMSAKGTAVYSCRFDGSLGERLGLVVRDEEGALVFADGATLLPAKPCCRRAFLQGLFVSAGSVVAPQEDSPDSGVRYHLELRFTDAELARAVCDSYGGARIMQRKNHTVLYIKDSERIADFLVYVDATGAKLELESVMVLRSVRNSVNRKNNCEVANIGKTVDAAGRQLEAIALLRSSGQFDALPDALKDIALLREQNTDWTLEQIALALRISKSGANHRFAKLIELADQQRKKL